MGFQGQLQVIGPLARSVSDLAVALRVLAGPDGIDALSIPVHVGDPSAVDVRELSVAWCEGEGVYPVRSDIIAALEAAALHLSRLGLNVVHKRPPHLERAEPLYARMRSMDGLWDIAHIARGREDELSPWTQRLLSAAKADTVPAFLEANAERDRLRFEAFEFMTAHQVLLMPVAALPAFPLGQRSFQVDGVDLPYVQVGACCRAISLFGFPVTVVPCGYSVEGLPLGIQIICARFMDHVALAVASVLEREFGGVNSPRGEVLLPDNVS
jgi:Asp-tRNA(Asn)/Glu-tRNA(Gln) amidotransferase A subunit family amidase